MSELRNHSGAWSEIYPDTVPNGRILHFRNYFWLHGMGEVQNNSGARNEIYPDTIPNGWITTFPELFLVSRNG